MSRGRGAVERAILDLFARHPTREAGVEWDTLSIACAVLGVVTTAPITPAQHSSFRRALGRLVRQGELVDLGREYRDGRRRYAVL